MPAADTSGPAAVSGQRVRVHLLNFPLALYARTSEHHDEVMREFALLALRPPTTHPGYDLPSRLLGLIADLHAYSDGARQPDARRDAALRAGQATVDLTYEMPVEIGPQLVKLYDLLEEADDYCRSEQLLTLAMPDDQRRFRQWYLISMLDQLNGKPPVPWDRPLA